MGYVFGGVPICTQRIKSAIAGDFCEYCNLNSQISNDFDILIMVSKEKFQKILNGQTPATKQAQTKHCDLTVLRRMYTMKV